MLVCVGIMFDPQIPYFFIDFLLKIGRTTHAYKVRRKVACCTNTLQPGPDHKIQCTACADPEGGTRGPNPPPLKNHKNIVVLAILVQIPLNRKATKPAFNIGP